MQKWRTQNHASRTNLRNDFRLGLAHKLTFIYTLRLTAGSSQKADPVNGTLGLPFRGPFGSFPKESSGEKWVPGFSLNTWLSSRNFRNSSPSAQPQSSGSARSAAPRSGGPAVHRLLLLSGRRLVAGKEVMANPDFQQPTSLFTGVQKWSDSPLLINWG